MEKVVDNILEIWSPSEHKCNILATRCKIHVGDTIRIGCYLVWDDDPWTPMVNVWAKLRFVHGDTYVDRFLGQTDSKGWYGGYYTVVKEDLLNPCYFGYVGLVAHTVAQGTSPSHEITYDCLYTEQSVSVVEDVWPYNRIPGATVTCTGKPSCITDSEGKCIFTGLNPDTEYTFRASKSGYECVACEHTTKPGAHFGFWLKPPVPYCTQKFAVYHPDGTPASNATVRVDDTTRLGSATNIFEIELKEGTRHVAYASKDGYENSDVYTIKSACEGTVRLTLKSVAPPPVEYCDQKFATRDETTEEEITNTTVKVGTKTSTYSLVGTIRPKIKNLIKGNSYTATAYSDEYNGSAIFTACEKSVVDIYMTREEVPPPEEATHYLEIELKPLSWANYDKLYSKLPDFAETLANAITLGGTIGWKVLDAKILRNEKVKLRIYLLETGTPPLIAAALAAAGSFTMLALYCGFLVLASISLYNITTTLKIATTDEAATNEARRKAIDESDLTPEEKLEALGEVEEEEVGIIQTLISILVTIGLTESQAKLLLLAIAAILLLSILK